VQLIGHELTRIVYLTSVVRPAGGAFLPDVAQRVLQKYSFVKFPSVDDLQKEGQLFSVGKFQDVQIDELKVYGDGIIVSGKCSTDILDAFIQDLFGWLKADFGIEETSIIQKPEKHFEGALLVKTERDLTSVLSPPKRVTNLIEQTMLRHTEHEYQPSVIYFETDTVGLKGRRRPNRLTLERRIGLPFGTNIFFSQAPMKSADHFALLEALEGLAD
jgi:hypothetical protein